jgi:serine/threonine-protein kinase
VRLDHAAIDVRTRYEAPVPASLPWRSANVLFVYVLSHVEPGPATPELLLLGGTALRGLPTTEADRLLSQSKAVALLVYLVLSPPGRYQRRDLLVGLLWPELDQEHARTALRKTLHLIRSVLGRDALLARGDEEVSLAPGALRCDVIEFITAADAGQLVRAFELHKGELLAGFHLADCAEFGQWIDEQRAHVQRQLAAAAWTLAVRLEHEGELTVAGEWARRAVRYAGSDERVLRKSMQMLDRLGDRAGALKIHDEFARRMLAEFGARPSPDTETLANSLRK